VTRSFDWTESGLRLPCRDKIAKRYVTPAVFAGALGVSFWPMYQRAYSSSPFRERFDLPGLPLIVALELPRQQSATSGACRWRRARSGTASVCAAPAHLPPYMPSLPGRPHYFGSRVGKRRMERLRE